MDARRQISAQNKFKRNDMRMPSLSTKTTWMAEEEEEDDDDEESNDEY